MSSNANPIGWLKVYGTPFEIGAAMGMQGRTAVHENLLQSEIWTSVTDPEHAATVARLMQNTQTCFPEIHEELCGLADGLELPLAEVYAWNCRGDILASVPDGCTTIQTPGSEIGISHNEDGLPFFRGHCYILDAKPKNSLGFRAFCYPGSLAGHTFGWNDAGLAQAVNNLRLQQIEAMIPRMVLGRAVLASTTLQDAIDVLSNDPRCGGFHMTLAQAGNTKLLSVEYGGGTTTVMEITSPNAHANHALHLAHQGQIITQSSQDRQETAERLVRNLSNGGLDILRDTSGPGLPIRRDDPQDPDNENTLATCVLNVSKTGVEWRIYGEKTGQPTYQSECEIA